MKVEQTGQLNMFFIPNIVAISVLLVEVKGAYVLFSQSEIISKMSASDLFVSSKPGVSTKQTSQSLSSGKESLMTEIWPVYDCKPCPALPAVPVAISMNFCTK